MVSPTEAALAGMANRTSIMGDFAGVKERKAARKRAAYEMISGQIQRGAENLGAYWEEEDEQSLLDARKAALAAGRPQDAAAAILAAPVKSSKGRRLQMALSTQATEEAREAARFGAFEQDRARLGLERTRQDEQYGYDLSIRRPASEVAADRAKQGKILDLSLERAERESAEYPEDRAYEIGQRERQTRLQAFEEESARIRIERLRQETRDHNQALFADNLVKDIFRRNPGLYDGKVSPEQAMLGLKLDPQTEAIVSREIRQQSMSWMEKQADLDFARSRITDRNKKNLQEALPARALTEGRRIGNMVSSLGVGPEQDFGLIREQVMKTLEGISDLDAEDKAILAAAIEEQAANFVGNQRELLSRTRSRQMREKTANAALLIQTNRIKDEITKKDWTSLDGKRFYTRTDAQRAQTDKAFARQFYEDLQEVVNDRIMGESSGLEGETDFGDRGNE